MSQDPIFSISPFSAHVFGLYHWTRPVEGGCQISQSNVQRDLWDAFNKVLSDRQQGLHLSPTGTLALYEERVFEAFMGTSEWSGLEGEHPQECTLEGDDHHCPSGTFVLQHEEGGKVVVHSCNPPGTSMFEA